ncbi:serine/threonine/dual specificity protein kinase, catalytic domain-containing protein [Artemisia annua]|uniref:Serine/threonine/dual specificity protein kinase, catalytic domain-containing protein n=1 Tax=Artemisia annua TaxID=35608 RepID=A0A2U1LR70_ARTAN|nr:serine/threonine/dual specificity protein kinase, catalytic domain-containing protein [Artemisia annua]
MAYGIFLLASDLASMVLQDTHSWYCFSAAIQVCCSKEYARIGEAVFSLATLASCSSELCYLDPYEETTSSSPREQLCHHFPIGEIQSATQDFSERFLIGQGGFGKVYKGRIRSGSKTIVAIKRLDSSSAQGAPEFWAEVEMLSMLRHCNLVSLIGYCNDNKEMILVYEYMSNGTLEDHLHKLRTPLSWLQRLKICIGAARALHYLHTGTGTEQGIIHRDVKSSNILLNQKWAAKILDFGLSKISHVDKPITYVSTLVKGTFGYFDPEYFSTGRLTRKSDVFSFGVIMLEILCRKRAVDRSLDEEEWGLVGWAQDSLREGKLKQIIDPELRGEISLKCLNEYAKLVDGCLHSRAKLRITMAEVLVGLESILELQESRSDSSIPRMGVTAFGRKLQNYFFSSEKNSDNRYNNGAPSRWSSNPTNDDFRKLVAAGWPEWLAIVAGEALNGWLPCEAGTFKKLGKIGEGRHSVVYKARDNSTGNLVALKKVRCDTSDPESVKMMASEIVILRHLDHPNVIKLGGIVTSRRSESLYLVFEYMEHDLAGLAANPRIQFTEAQVKHYMHQLISGLKHCHDHQVLHRDIKGSDLLLDNSGVLKIADFGSASFFDLINEQPLTNPVVTFWYRAPELLLGATDYGVGVDLWSAGCILAGLLAKRPILDGNTEVEQLQKIFELCGSPPDEYWKRYKLPGEKLYRPQQQYKRCITKTFKDFPSSSFSLLESLLSVDPLKRRRAGSALKSKRLDSSSAQGAPEFWAEVEMLSMLRHCNLVSLIGYCNDNKEMILVYEYMSNGTLEDHLHKLRTPLSWFQRLKICIGAARALHYLHTGTGTEQGVIHRDVKSSNILLDQKWAAKISDFGLSKISHVDKPITYVSTLVKGTFGYFDPEYFSTGRLTRKSDVFSFGVIMLEILCRKRAVDSSLDEEEWGLVGWAQDSLRKGKLKQIIDPELRGEISLKCLNEYAKLVDGCLHSRAKLRITMAEVLVGLESILELQERSDSSIPHMGVTAFGRKLQNYFFSSEKNSDNIYNKTNDDWPPWLATAAGKALNGWLPCKAGTFKKLGVIGEGRHSVVYKARDISTGNLVALKKVRCDTSDPESVKMIASEIVILRRLDHPNVIKLGGIVISKRSESLYLVFEYMEHDLAALAANPRIQFTEAQIKHYMHQLISGLKHCHDHQVLHRDIKGSDLLLDNNGVLKIADFGSASFFDLINEQPLTNPVVTFWYRAPELLLGATDYGVGVDLWSVGCILAGLLAKRPILDGNTEKIAKISDIVEKRGGVYEAHEFGKCWQSCVLKVEQLQKIFELCGSPPDEYWKRYKLSGEKLYRPQQQYKRCITKTFKDFPSSSFSLLESLLSVDPLKRRRAGSALKSKFFSTCPDDVTLKPFQTFKQGDTDGTKKPTFDSGKQSTKNEYTENQPGRRKRKQLPVIIRSRIQKSNTTERTSEYGSELRKKGLNIEN